MMKHSPGACAVLLTLAFVTTTAWADICRKTGADGVVSFSSDCGKAAGQSAPEGYIYHYRRADGGIYLTNAPQASLKLVSRHAYYTLKGWSDSPSSNARWTLNRVAYDALIRTAAQRQGIDQSLVRAVVHAESGFDPQALSPKGAAGLMQLMPATAARFGVTDSHDPAENLRGGVSYLRFLLDRFGGDVRLALAAYNAGEAAISRYGGVPPYTETTAYVTRVLALRDRYRDTPGAHPGQTPAEKTAHREENRAFQ